jgi:hypothetical protein
MALVASILTGGALVKADNPRYTINPSVFVPGKSYTITIQDTKCDKTDKTSDLSTAVPPVASGAGIKITASDPPLAHVCDWTGTLTVGQDAETGDFSVVVTPSKTESSLIPIKIIAKAAGPIPPGLEPSVDVAWGVLPKRVSSDNFGGRVTKLYYPIQVVIGNNSGYDLQLASVQFKLPDSAALDSNIPTDSYYVVRASLQREQLVGARNTTVNIIKAIGPVLTGSTVFFDGASAAAIHHKSIFQGWTNVFSNPFEKGIELIVPDQTVQQLINLDNHTLRDGIIIANNTQVRTIVFVNRALLTQSALTNGTPPPGKSAASARRDANARLAKELETADNNRVKEFDEADRMLSTATAAAEQVRAAKVSAALSRSDPGRATDIASADSEAAAAIAAAAQRAAAAKAAATDSAAAAKRAALRASGKMEAKILGGDGNKFGRHEYDGQEVMRQLGSLQLVGRSIVYLNRVSVISTAPGAGPQFTLSPTSIAQGAAAFTLTLTGDGLSGGTLTASNKDIVITNPKVGDSGKSFTATVDASKAAAGSFTFTLTTASGSQSAQFEVKAAALTISSPQATPISVTAGAAPTPFSVTGTNLKNVMDVQPDKNCAGTTIAVLSTDPLYTDTNLRISVGAQSAPQTDASCTAAVTDKSGNPPVTFPYKVVKKQ